MNLSSLSLYQTLGGTYDKSRRLFKWLIGQPWIRLSRIRPICIYVKEMETFVYIWPVGHLILVHQNNQRFVLNSALYEAVLSNLIRWDVILSIRSVLCLCLVSTTSQNLFSHRWLRMSCRFQGRRLYIAVFVNGVWLDDRNSCVEDYSEKNHLTSAVSTLSFARVGRHWTRFVFKHATSCSVRAASECWQRRCCGHMTDSSTADN